MEEEEKKEDTNLDNLGQTPKDFGRVIDALHNKSKLSSLRTYQGDMAEFIKEKNESVISIAVKEKEGKEEEKKKEEEAEKEEKKDNVHLIPKPAQSKEGFQINFTMAFLSLLLVAGGILASFYIFEFIKKEPVSKVVVEEKIIPYNNLITLANLTGQNLGTELAKLSLSNGISILKISDADGRLLKKAQDFFDFLEVSLPATLGRTLEDEYAVGVISQNKEVSSFIIITVNDFGRAFSGMLDWEGNMEKDMSFLNTETNTGIVASTTFSVKIPLKQDFLSWKDIIVKNKDTRALANQKNQTKIAYSFLDKNTILITNNLPAIGEIFSIYASRSIAR